MPQKSEKYNDEEEPKGGEGDVPVGKTPSQ